MILASSINFPLTMEGSQSKLRNKVWLICKMGIILPRTVNDLLFQGSGGSYINLKLP